MFGDFFQNKIEDAGATARLKEMVAVLRRRDVVRGMTPEKLRCVLEDLGPTFVKLGQVMSMRPDFLPPEYCDALMKLQSEAKPLPFAVILGVIEQEYNRMTESLQELMRQNEAETRASVISEVRQLESQFHPHFLFNTLENIKFMVKLDSEAAIQMIQALSALLRYSIHEETRRVPLEKDLEYLHSYMKIQQYRFGQRLHYSEQIDDQVRGCLIPKLLFQPVLENAIKYGEAEDGTIAVRLCVMALGDDLMVSIEDKGRGMTPEVFAHLQQLLHNGENSSVHKGIYNVHRRIQLMFGTAYRLKLLQPSSGGTRIEMRLPRQEEP